VSQKSKKTRKLSKKSDSFLNTLGISWQLLVENAPVFFIILDKKGKILFINQTAAGFSKNKVIGTNAFDYIPKVHHHKLRNALKDVFRSGKQAHYETMGMGKQKQITWYSTRVGPVKLNKKNRRRHSYLRRYHREKAD